MDRIFRCKWDENQLLPSLHRIFVKDLLIYLHGLDIDFFDDLIIATAKSSLFSIDILFVPKLKRI